MFTLGLGIFFLTYNLKYDRNSWNSEHSGAPHTVKCIENISRPKKKKKLLFEYISNKSVFYLFILLVLLRPEDLSLGLIHIFPLEL